MASPSLPNRMYTVGWICALPVEKAAAATMLDEVLQGPQEQHPTDNNSYTLGKINNHNVVIACLPAGDYGIAPAATAAQQMLSSFRNVKFGLLVGIGGGIPRKGKDIRLGDVVVSEPHGPYGGVVQYDRGKTVTGRRFERTGFLNAPPRVLLNALNAMKANHILGQYRVPEFLKAITAKYPQAKVFSYPGAEHDLLYEVAEDLDDEACDTSVPAKRPDRASQDPVIHYGLIASGNQVIKDAGFRDELRSEIDNVLCFEMEAAGLLNAFPCLVIRGICDYADYHKNDLWQGYAAATAAACARELLYVIPARDVEDTDTASNALDFLQFLRFPEMNDRCQEVGDVAEGTCTWLLEDAVYARWHSEPNGLLWVSGKPGTGKSTLLKYLLARETEKLDYSEPHKVVLSFFFHGRGSELQRRPLGFFRAILHQLFLQYRGCVSNQLSDIAQEFNRNHNSIAEGEGKLEWRENELHNFLRTCIHKILERWPVLIMIDALDECAEEYITTMEKVVKGLKLGYSLAQHNLSICISCRHYPITKWRDGYEICVESKNMTDIRAYLQHELGIIENETDRKSLEMEIVDRSSSIFLWVTLVVSDILEQYKDGLNLNDIRSYLRTKPTNLNSIFEGIVLQLASERRSKNDLSWTLRLFQWLCFASRPLSVTELRFAITVDMNSSCHSLAKCLSLPGSIKDDQQMERLLKRLSGGLAEIKDRQGASVTQLIHQSVKDYLIDEGFQLLDGSLESPTQAIGLAHIRLSTTCIRYISMDEILQEKGNVSDLEFPFLDYSISWWISHAEEAAAMNTHQEYILSCFRWPSSLIFLSWVKLWTRRYTGWPVSRTTLLHATARHGLTGAVAAQLWKKGFMSDTLLSRGFNRLIPRFLSTRFQRVIQTKAEADLKDCDGRTPLSWAAARGHVEIVKLLLSRDDVDANSRDMLGRTPLSWATGNGNEEVVRLLLEKGVDINKKALDHATVLHLAVRNGNEGLVQLLLKKGAALNEKDDKGRTALHEAALYGHEVVVQLLLNAGADTNEKDKHGDNALHRACGNKNERIARLLMGRESDLVAVMQLLLTAGVDINAEDSNGGTALHRAAKNGRKKLVALLIQKGADVAVKDRHGRTALGVVAETGDDLLRRMLKDVVVGTQASNRIMMLESSVKQGDEEAVRLLLESGAEVTNKALSVASKNGHGAIVRLLLGKEPNINIIEQVLTAAAVNGHEAMIRLLLESGANARATQLDGQSLRQAARYGHETIVRLLLEHGVTTRTTDEYTESALHWAALYGYEEIARMLLNAGASVHSEEFYSGTPLHYAARGGHDTIVELLLKHGAAVDQRVFYTRETPLHVVAANKPNGYKAVLQLLRKKNFGVDKPDLTPSDGHNAVVRLLLKNGADIRTKPTPLQVAQACSESP